MDRETFPFDREAWGTPQGRFSSRLAREPSTYGHRAGARSVRALFASSEVSPLAKTGGLADVSAALPAALANLGADIAIIMPGYPAALDAAKAKQPAVPLGDIVGLGETNLIAARTPDTGLPLWLVDCPRRFRRPGGLYIDHNGCEWPDNALRFALFSHVVARVAHDGAGTNWTPDIVHVNDWHLGLVPALLTARPGPRPASLLTIHNLAFQGVFPADIFPDLGLPQDWFTEGFEYYGQISFLKAAIRYADRLTTVSSTYAREILTPEFGCGLDGLLRTRAHDLIGILNGIDDDAWSPGNSSQVPFPFGADDLSGKQRCKRALQQEFGLEIDATAPLIAFVSRLTEQKMADLLPETASAIMDEGGQLVICGEGDRPIEQTLRALAARHPGRIAVRIGYNEALAKRILGGADMLAAPARFEPCGLTQMYAMQYGTIPIVTRVGGLADTVIGYGDNEVAPPQEATGFFSSRTTGAGISSAIKNACRVYRDPAMWRAMQRAAMARQSCWKRSAERYATLYKELAEKDDQKGLGLKYGPATEEMRPLMLKVA